MAVPNELSLEAIRDFMLENGGKVTNHDLVKHFKRFLTDPETRDEARNQFKEYVNMIATIRNEDGEKYLVLKKKYRNPIGIQSSGKNVASPVVSPSPSYDSLQSMSPSTYPSSTFSVSQESLEVVSPSRMPPPYRAPPPPSPPISPSSSVYASPPPPPPVRQDSVPSEETVSPRDIVRSPSRDDDSFEAETLEETVIHAPPPVPPRRKSTDKMKLENKENVPDGTVKRPKTVGSEAGKDVADGEEQKISVKERMLKFNRLATETDIKSHVVANKKKYERGTADDDDCASVTTLDPKSREWLVCASQANYHALAKLSSENPRLAKLKDPTSGYTALHWAAKHGQLDVVKLIAGTYGLDVNCRSNGGYTPLHMAMQFGHEEVYNLLVKVYNADPNLRDWSGRKPRQYQASQDTAVSADTFRKIKARKKQSEKDLGFLRIGSLNVRVKRTTEAFSNFLGVGQSSDKLHKTWGSADNIQQVDRRMMPPPKFAPIKKRRSKRAQDFAMSHSTPSTPPSEPRRSSGEAADSDSDTACGFGSNWQSTV